MFTLFKDDTHRLKSSLNHLAQYNKELHGKIQDFRLKGHIYYFNRRLRSFNHLLQKEHPADSSTGQNRQCKDGIFNFYLPRIASAYLRPGETVSFLYFKCGEINSMFTSSSVQQCLMNDCTLGVISLSQVGDHLCFSGKLTVLIVM